MGETNELDQFTQHLAAGMSAEEPLAAEPPPAAAAKDTFDWQKAYQNQQADLTRKQQALASAGKALKEAGFILTESGDVVEDPNFHPPAAPSAAPLAPDEDDYSWLNRRGIESMVEQKATEIAQRMLGQQLTPATQQLHNVQLTSARLLAQQAKNELRSNIPFFERLETEVDQELEGYIQNGFAASFMADPIGFYKNVAQFVYGKHAFATLPKAKEQMGRVPYMGQGDAGAQQQIPSELNGLEMGITNDEQRLLNQMVESQNFDEKSKQRLRQRLQARFGDRRR